MELAIDRELVPVRYLIGVPREEGDKETDTDLLYELVAHLEVNGLLGKEFKATDVWKDVRCRPYPEGLTAAFDVLTKQKFLSKRNVKNTAYYKLIHHPWV